MATEGRSTCSSRQPDRRHVRLEEGSHHLEKGEVLDAKRLKAGKLDGLVVQSDGSKLVSSWDGKHIVRISPQGTTKTILTGVSTPAAFDVDEERQRLVVPLVQENRVAVAPLQ